MHYLRSLGSRDRVFESHSGRGCLVFVYVCAFFCACVQVEALRRADHPSRESCRLSLIKKLRKLSPLLQKAGASSQVWQQRGRKKQSTTWDQVTIYVSVSQPPDRGPVPGPGINYTGPSSYRKKNLTGCGLAKVENHWFTLPEVWGDVVQWRIRKVVGRIYGSLSRTIQKLFPRMKEYLETALKIKSGDTEIWTSGPALTK
jgi:hypothetical protein